MSTPIQRGKDRKRRARITRAKRRARNRKTKDFLATADGQEFVKEFSSWFRGTAWGKDNQE